MAGLAYVLLIWLLASLLFANLIVVKLDWFVNLTFIQSFGDGIARRLDNNHH